MAIFLLSEEVDCFLREAGSAKQAVAAPLLRRSWIGYVVQNCSKRERPLMTTDTPQPSLLQDLIHDDRLTPDQKTFLRLRFQESRTETEVARLMGMTPDQCRDFEATLLRGLRTLGKPTLQ